MANKTTPKKLPKAQVDPFVKVVRMLAETSFDSPDAFLVTRHPNGKEFIVLHWSFKKNRSESLSREITVKFTKGKVVGLGTILHESPQATRRRHEKTVNEVIRLSGKNINADGKPNASREELRFLGPKAVKFLMSKMGRGDVGVQIGKTGLKLTVMRDYGAVVPAVPGMKHERTIVSGRGNKGRFTHTYTKPGVKFGSF